MDYALYAAAVAMIVGALILSMANRRASWKDGVTFAIKRIDSEANRYRVLYNHRVESGWQNGDHAKILNGQVEALRTVQVQLEYEMMSRFMVKEDPDLGE